MTDTDQAYQGDQADHALRRLEDEPKDAQPARCGACNHVWVVAYLPMEIAVFVRVARGARCPMCGSAKLFLLDTRSGSEA